MKSPLRAIEFKYQVGEAIDYQRLLIEAGRGVHHAEYPQPGRHSVQVRQLTFQATQD